MMTGIAKGSLILSNIWRSVRPIARPASKTAGATPLRPMTVLLKIGNIE
jgi:hypothetical protein